MEDPTRLLSAHGGASRLERELLESVPDVVPPAGAKDRAWQGLAGQIAAAAAVGAGASAAKAAGALAKASAVTGAAAATTSAGTSVLATKLVAVAVAGGLAVGGGVWAFSSPARDAPQRATAPIAAPQQEPVPDVVPTDSAQELEDEAPKPAAPSRMGVKRRDSLLRESALLKQARAHLQSGDAAAAQASLDRLSTEFPVGVLRQEREVLAISVLSAGGQKERAQVRARAFVKAHPKSPHSATLRELLEAR